MSARILLHPATGMVSPVCPAAHRRAPDALLEFMKREGVPLTRANYIGLAMAGAGVEWAAEHEADLPEELRDWEAFFRESDEGSS